METQKEDIRARKDDRTWGFLAHLGGVIGQAFFSPVGNIIGALVIWLFKRNESKFVDIEGKEAVNFQITISLLMVALNIINGIAWGVWSFTHFLVNEPFVRHGHWDTEFFFTFGFSKVIWAVNLAFSIIAAIQANKGNHYRYPFSLRLVK
ncbi:DUF4870 domain-containing protein [Chitinophaga barathri]|uniref:DUF4870 domain-containing protein n=1 Tax=Chitinophaga barathri TaxID=1647451 RepID=A0A3N4MH13_9BACT|nr:DUF4870 domain-containing protein [Chitinophaga barathri]RPD42725.1 DUF4870 domain-containing protein [Chitinophaga barathri]